MTPPTSSAACIFGQIQRILREMVRDMTEGLDTVILTKRGQNLTEFCSLHPRVAASVLSAPWRDVNPDRRPSYPCIADMARQLVPASLVSWSATGPARQRFWTFVVKRLAGGKRQGGVVVGDDVDVANVVYVGLHWKGGGGGSKKWVTASRRKRNRTEAQATRGFSHLTRIIAGLCASSFLSFLLRHPCT